MFTKIVKLYSFLFLALFASPAFAEKFYAEIEYFYSDDGTLTGKAFNGKRVNFEYDLRGQLLAVKDAQGKDLERYTYDRAGNRLSKTINGVTTTYTYDKANQLVTSTVNGKTTRYKYDAVGRMIQAGDKTYIYNGQNKVSEVRQNGKTIAKFEYNIDGQIAKAIYGDKVEEFMWDGLALIWRSGVTYINEPYVTGGNPVMAGDDVLFNDMLGNTLAVNDKAVEMTSFGETGDKNAFFTGKPMIDELGYSFLFRDYNPNQGKWTTTDPLGYPDGWNNLAYCNNGVTTVIDYCGGVTISSLYDALNHYAWGDGEKAIVGTNVILESTSTSGYSAQLQAVQEKLLNQQKTVNQGFVSHNDSFTWDQGYVLGRNTMYFYTSFNWTASNWIKEGDKYSRTLSGSGNILLYTQDDWDFKVHKSDDYWNTLKREVAPNIVANLYSRIVTGANGDEFHMTGSARIKNYTFSVKQYE